MSETRVVSPEMTQTADTLTVVDNRTGREYTMPIEDGAVRATDLAQIDGLVSYDPAFLNTASCRSAITFIDGDAGILRYRGYPIEQLAEEAGFLETAYLLFEGGLPTTEQLEGWRGRRPLAHVRAHERDEVPGRPSATTRIRWEMLLGGGRSAVDLLSRREGHRPTRRTATCSAPVDGEGPDDRGVHLPALARPAVRPAAQRPRLHRQLREHDVRDRRRTRPTRCCSARSRSC